MPQKVGATGRDAKSTAPRKRQPSVRRAAHRVARDEWHWFDHPEMQARIAEAEADVREGRVEHFDSVDGLLKRLESLL